MITEKEIKEKIADDLVNQKILIEKKQGNQRVLQANIENHFFKQLKIAFSVKKIQDSDILQYLEEELVKTDLDEEIKDLVRDCAVLGMATSMGGAIDKIRRKIND